MARKSDPSYPGGFPAILRQMSARLDPLTYAEGEALPPLDIDLTPLKTRLVDRAETADAPSRSSFARKLRELSDEFHARPELLRLHGLLVANLRRTAQPPHCAPLFQRLWAEQGDWLREELDARWLVSAVTTFGDHGVTEAQRRLGQTLSVLFGTMKLYETERLYSGYAPDAPFPVGKRAAKRLPLDMAAYAIGGGGLDVNMLGRLWLDAGDDAVLGPLARHLLDMLIHDPGGVFRRLRAMRADKTEADPAPEPQTAPLPASQNAPLPEGVRRKAPRRSRVAAPVPATIYATARAPGDLRWGTVSLIKAPAAAILRFAAHHLDQGASAVHVYLDDPDPATLAQLGGHPALHVTACDDAWWAAQKKPRMPAHQMRQGWVATQCYAQVSDPASPLHLDWLAHIDVDELLLPMRPVARVLAALPADQAGLLLHPVELLAEPTPSDATPDSPPLARFKTTPRMAGLDKAVLADLYPNFGSHLRGGYISHLEGKIFARTGIPGLRVGVHGLLLDGAEIANRAVGTDILLGHAHAPDWATFRAHLDFRMTRGSYRKSEEEGFRLRDVLAYLAETEGDTGLRAFFDEVCTARPDLVTALRGHGMLVTWPLDLEAAVARHFHAVAQGQT